MPLGDDLRLLADQVDQLAEELAVAIDERDEALQRLADCENPPPPPTPVVTVTDLETLNDAIVEAGPGGTVEIVGEFFRKQPYLITAGGVPGVPVTIHGGTFRSNRAVPWTVGAFDGQPFFQLGVGASWLTFEDPIFENVGNGCYQIGAPLEGLTFDGFTVRNVQRFIENRIVAGQTDATIDGLTIKSGTVFAFTKGAIRLQYDTHGVLIEDVFGDSESIDGDNFAIGVHLTGTVHDVVHRRVTMNNCYDTKSNLYWNGDGFTSEIDTYNHTYEDCESFGCTDAGFDLKASNVVMTGCAAADNKRNFRLWGDATLTDCIGRNPNLRGGTGTQAQVHTASSAVVNLERFVAVDCDQDTIVFDADGSSVLTVGSADVTRHPTSRLSTQETNALVVFGDVTDNLCEEG